MRTRLLVAVMLSAAVVVATAAAASRSGTTVKISLPAPDSVRVSKLVVTSSSLPKLSVTNAAAVGGRQLNSQAIAEIVKKPTNGRYTIYVVIHRFPPVPSPDRAMQAPAYLYLHSSNEYKIALFLQNMTCDDLKKAGLTNDSGDAALAATNLIPTTTQRPRSRSMRRSTRSAPVPRSPTAAARS